MSFLERILHRHDPEEGQQGPPAVAEAGPRERAPDLIRDLRGLGWLVDATDEQLTRAVEASVRDHGRRRAPERGALERDILMLDPRTRNGALPASLTGEGFDLQLPTSDGVIVPIHVRVVLPPGGSGVAQVELPWGDGARRLALRAHDGLYNRGLAIRGLNRMLEVASVVWRFHERMILGVPILFVDEAQGAAMARLGELPWVDDLPSGGQRNETTRSAVARAARLRETGLAHPGLHDDLIARAFSGQRRFLERLEPDMIGNHVLVLDGLRALHLDLIRPFDSDRHEALVNALFHIGGAIFEGAEVTALDSSPSEEGPTELDLEWDGEEHRIHFKQENGVIEARLCLGLNELLASKGLAERFHFLTPTGDAPLVALMRPEQRRAAEAEGLARFADAPVSQDQLPEEERLVVERID